MTKAEYVRYAGKMQPESSHLTNITKAFFTGGIICVIGQALIELYSLSGITPADASSFASLTLIALAAVLTGVGLYDKIGKFAGAGSLVPITGFSNAIVSSALEFKSEGYVTGMCAKMFSLAGPVLVFGISASVLYGLILILSEVIF